MNPLLKLLLVFIGIVALLSRRWNLGLVLVLASVAVGLLFGHPLPHVGRDTLLATIDPLTLRLSIAIVLIMTLSEILKQTAGLEDMVKGLQSLVPSGRIVIAALPALVGLLPMVGGAMFSAPMVDEVGDHIGFNQERKTFINYWFRHIWEYVFPVYPSMMLGAALLDFTPRQLAEATWPLTVASATSGVLFGLIGAPQEPRDDEPSATSRAESARTLASSIWPIALVIILSLTLPIDERVSLVVSLVVTITLTMAAKHVPLDDLGTILRHHIPWETIVVLCGALIFRRVLDNSGAVVAVSNALIALHIPLALVAFTVPFIAGLLTGLSMAAFSIGFPVVMPLVTAGGGAVAPAWAVWLMAGGFLGVLLSPLHLCLSLTRLYFEAEWSPIYRRIAPSVLSVAAVATAILLLT